LLLRLAAAGDGGAIDALERLSGEGVDAALGDEAANPSAEVRLLVARLLGVRRAAEQREVLVALGGDGQPSAVRTTALLALAALADPGDAGAAYRRAADAANGAEQRGWVLRALAARHDMADLPLAMAWLDDESIGVVAARTAVAIAREADTAAAPAALAALERVVAAHGDDASVREAAGSAMSHVERNVGFITVWTLAGPYMQEGVGGQALFDVAFVPEPGGPSGTVQWRQATDDVMEPPGIVDLQKAFGGENRVAYLRTILVSDRPRPIRLELGSDDGLKVWLNGDLVHANDVMRGLTPGQDVVEVSLKEGANTLLLKVNQGGGDWSACCRARAADGFRLEGVRVESPW
jgi:hypothetical protein